MGRLFWKIFLFLWLAQFLVSLGVGIAIWSLRPEHRPPPGFVQAPPGAGETARPPPPGAPPRARLLPFLPPPEPLIGGVVVSLLSAALLARYFSRPIRSLRAAFAAVADGKLQTRVGAGMGRRKDELADLGGDFDRMADRLEALIGAQRRLMHDISHELRSPLARLQAAAGLLRQQPGRADELIARIERDTGRMDGLVGELLTLARLESGMAGALCETVDLVDLAATVADDAAFEAEGAGCRVEIATPAACRVRGNGELLRRALDNIVRNALRHSPAGGCVEIDVRELPAMGEIRLCVSDRGPGIAEGDCERIFEAFVRGEGDGGGGGYGLGLAITRGIVEMHGGRVRAANRDGGGLQVTLSLPAEGRAG